MLEGYIAQNLLWLRENFPNVYTQIQNRQPDETKVRLTFAKNGQTNIEIKLEDKWISLYSRYNPEQEAYRWAQQLELEAGEVILVGYGLGYHIKALLQLKPHVQVYVFEPNEHLMRAAVQGSILFDLPLSRVRSISVGCLGDDKERFKESVATFFRPIIDRLYNKNIQILFVPAYQRWFQKEKQIITDVMKKMIANQRFELHTTVAFEERWTINALKNLRYALTTPSVSVLKQKAQGHPLIIVSSGPSMEKEVELLKKNRERAIILAAGSSVNGLVHHGVLPHAVVSFDPAPQNKKVFELLFSHGVQVPLIFGTTIYHEILSDYHYQNLFHVIISQDTITPWIFQHLGEMSHPVLSDAPTVAILALQLAVYWGCHPIIFVGQDFAAPSNKFYAEGVTHLRSSPYLSEEERKEYIEVEKVGGGTVLTSLGLNRMRESMESLLNHFLMNNSHLLFINTSSDGARIRGTVEMPLREALRIYGTDGTRHDEWFQSKEYPSYSDRLTEAKRYLDELFLTQADLDRVMEKLEQISKKLKKHNKRDELIKIFSKLDQATTELQKQPLFQMLYHPMLRTQFDLYNRMAAQVFHQFASAEKAHVIQQRLEAILNAYNRTKRFIQEHLDSLLSLGN